MPQVAGCIAPPLTLETLASYRELAKSAPAPVADAMLRFCELAEFVLAHPPAGEGFLAPLTEAEVTAYWDLCPFMDECLLLEARFESIDAQSQKTLRDAAYHLSWFAKEIALDRVPMTTDKL